MYKLWLKPLTPELYKVSMKKFDSEGESEKLIIKGNIVIQEYL